MHIKVKYDHFHKKKKRQQKVSKSNSANRSNISKVAFAYEHFWQLEEGIKMIY